jgi:hypothetical protein
MPVGGSVVDVAKTARKHLAERVQLYTHAVGLNIWIGGKGNDTEDSVEVPVGCVRQQLLQSFRRVNLRANGTQLTALCDTMTNCDPNVEGHVLAQVFAFELSSFGSKISKLGCALVSKGKRTMQTD